MCVNFLSALQLLLSRLLRFVLLAPPPLLLLLLLDALVVVAAKRRQCCERNRAQLYLLCVCARGRRCNYVTNARADAHKQVTKRIRRLSFLEVSPLSFVLTRDEL